MSERETWDNLCEDAQGCLRFIDTDRLVPADKVYALRHRAYVEMREAEARAAREEMAMG